ncbi:MAG: sugar ABC transporter permease [Lachnospiraceae bacterium]|nr:sugar ABC transporter permease [Lachnospiraceae bacterium]
MKIDLKKYRVKPKNYMDKKDAKSKRVSWLFLFPSLTGVMLFFLVPYFIIIFYSFIMNPPTDYSFVGFKNYFTVFNNAAFRTASLNTIKFTFLAVPLAVVIPLLLALLLDIKIPFKSQFRTAFLTPLMVPVASVVLVWQVIFHYNGLGNEILNSLNIDSVDWFNSEQALFVIVVLFLWKNIGYNMILFMAALGSVPRDLLEVAYLENASGWNIFWNIKFRYMTSTLLFVTIMSIINSFKVFREIFLLKGAHPTSYMYMLQTYMNNKFDALDHHLLSAAAIVMSIVMIIIIGVLFLLEGRVGKDIEEA